MFYSARIRCLLMGARAGGIATVKCMHLKGIVMDESSARLEQLTATRFEYEKAN